MKTISTVAVAVGLCIAVLAWIFFPTSIEAVHDTYEPLTTDEFMQVRSDSIALENSVRAKGIELIAGDLKSQSVQFDCKGVPVLTLINGPIVFSVLTYVDADRRAPDVASFRMQLYARLKKSGAPLVSDAAPSKPNAIEAFVLKHRDGIDVMADCSQ